MITIEDLQKVEIDLTKKSKIGIPEANYQWPNAPLNIIDCVLSLNRKYETMVIPRVQFFKEKHPNCNSIPDFIELIEEYGGNYEAFTMKELNLKHAERGRIIYDVCKYLQQEISEIKGADENESLRLWANSVRPGDAFFMGIKGFSLSGFQYLRMLFGAQTAKPDVHIINYVSEVIGRKVNDIESLYILEKVSKKCNIPLRDLDSVIWKERALKQVLGDIGNVGD